MALVSAMPTPSPSRKREGSETCQLAGLVAAGWAVCGPVGCHLVCIAPKSLGIQSFRQVSQSYTV